MAWTDLLASLLTSPVAEVLFRRVLHLAVAERPVFPGVVDEIDPDVFSSYAGPRVNLVGYPLIEFFLYICGPAADPGDLNQDQIVGVCQAEVSLFRIDDFISGMT